MLQVHQSCPTAKPDSTDPSTDGSDVNSHEDVEALRARQRSAHALHIQDAPDTLAQKFALPPGEVLRMLCHASAAGKDAASYFGHLPFARQSSAPEIGSGHVRCDHLGRRLSSRAWQPVGGDSTTGKTQDIEDCELALAQFEAAGSLMTARRGMAAQGL
jgi:hypothetical protein